MMIAIVQSNSLSSIAVIAWTTHKQGSSCVLKCSVEFDLEIRCYSFAFLMSPID